MHSFCLLYVLTGRFLCCRLARLGQTFFSLIQRPSELQRRLSCRIPRKTHTKRPKFALRAYNKSLEQPDFRDQGWHSPHRRS